MTSLKTSLFCVLVLVASCSKTPQAADPIPEHQTFTLQSVAVDEPRTINVWTPPEYSLGAAALPVLYMPDGGIREDFPHIANTLADLIESKRIPPFILVGIENTKRARDLTGPTEVAKDAEIAEETSGAANFRAFINNELIPRIDATYRTTPRKGIIGESLAGLFVVETFLLQPGDFDFYIAFDPSLWWNGHDYDRNAAGYLVNLPDRRTRIWFATSSAEGMSGAGHNLAKAFQGVSADKLVWEFSDEPDEEHHTIFRATKEKAIVWALNEE